MAARALTHEAARAYQAARANPAVPVEFETIKQLIGRSADRVLYQVEYVENDSDVWNWLVHSQHQAEFRNRLDLSEVQALEKRAERAAIADAEKLRETYEDVRVVRLSVQAEWTSW
ncbi:hypothetical protein ACF05W_03225 [Streptomyces lydicus]|uniref:hypothetical protein n=1 Tax=Streptomyces lydicus TaxID=47763 RepID=UPI0036FFD257